MQTWNTTNIRMLIEIPTSRERKRKKKYIFNKH